MEEKQDIAKCDFLRDRLHAHCLLLSVGDTSPLFWNSPLFSPRVLSGSLQPHSNLSSLPSCLVHILDLPDPSCLLLDVPLNVCAQQLPQHRPEGLHAVLLVIQVLLWGAGDLEGSHCCESVQGA